MPTKIVGTETMASTLTRPTTRSIHTRDTSGINTGTSGINTGTTGTTASAIITGRTNTITAMTLVATGIMVTNIMIIAGNTAD